ncbi:MAG TPA: hypothetical protein PLX06_03375, partial [Fimbriimonadaceae bacterium]|nr:hypothetical protein [Fimbriimonadaceae bacterium]
GRAGVARRHRRGGGGFGGASANLPAATKAQGGLTGGQGLVPSERRYRSDSGLSKDLDDLGVRQIWWDPQTKLVNVRKADGKVEQKPFNLLPNVEIEALAMSFDAATEKAFLATLRPELVERYWYHVKVDRKVRGQKVSVYSIQIWTEDWKPEYSQALVNAGLKEIQSAPALKTVFGSANQGALHKLASLPFVKRILPLEG